MIYDFGCVAYGIEISNKNQVDDGRIMEIKEAERVIDNMYQDKMNTRVEITANNTVIHVNKKVTFTELEVASVILLREELSLKRKLEEKNKIIELMADYIDLNGECVDSSKKNCAEPHCQKCIIDYFTKKVR